MHPAYVVSTDALRAITQRIEGAREVAIDCEFQGEGRYYPKLCLVQLAFGTELVVAHPARVDLAVLAPVLESASVKKLVHDGRQDLPILARATGVREIRAVFDTQIAAAFAGYGGSVGYGALVKDLSGIELDKSLQVSDWTKELSDAQIEYALDDVRHLGRVSDDLRTRLGESGRLEWAEAACAEASERALTVPDPDKLYRRVGSTGRLTDSQLGILREVAKWRDHVASSVDKPLPVVANDLALKSMALQPPRELRALDNVRGLGAGRSSPWARELLDAVARGVARPEPARAVSSKEREGTIDGVVSVLNIARRIVSVREGIAAELLADQADVRALAEWHLDERPEGSVPSVLGGWRRAILGTLLLDVLSGAVVFRADATSAVGVDIIRA